MKRNEKKAKGMKRNEKNEIKRIGKGRERKKEERKILMKIYRY
jgi:hypothetical protein